MYGENKYIAMKEGSVILTAAGFFNTEVLNCVVSKFTSKENVRIAIVTTAAEEKEKNKYSQLAKQQFNSVGFTAIDFVDIEETVAVSFDPYQIVYVCGGNTFTLMKFAREADFSNSVNKLLLRGGVYIGVSAGSVIAGPSIRIAAELSPDVNSVGLVDMSGMGITDTIIYPHYKDSDENQIKKFEARHNHDVVRLTNNQAVIIQTHEQQIIG